MVRPVVRDPVFLSQRSAPATRADLPTAADLRDTLLANAERCVGMAANMIGIKKRIIVFMDGPLPAVMFNPELLHAEGEYEAEEGCLSLTGTRRAKRYQSIRVRFRDERFLLRTREYTGWTAQIIQHELDHCDGILI